ncbi:1069_t:CDS:2, partial [Funneliformis caledonium]
ALDDIINVKCLPTEFNTIHSPSPNNCELCNKSLIVDYYKKEIETNVKSFLNRLEKDSIILTEENRNLEGEKKEVQEKKEEIEVINKIHL